MRPSSPIVVVVALAALAAGCTKFKEEIETSRVEAEMQSRPTNIRPGLEPLQYRPQPAMPDQITPERPEQPDPSALPFPWVDIPWSEAEAMLAGDPAALRFLALKHLGQDGLIGLEDVIQRRAANLGALLPITVPTPPAAGLDRPTAPPSSLVKRFNHLFNTAKGTPETRRAERGFLLDAMMPGAKAPRTTLAAPIDMAQARAGLARLDRLKQTGLITRSEQEGEAQALQKMIADGALPETLIVELPPPPPPPPAKKVVKKPGSGRPVGRMEGGVSGRFEVIPSPPQVSAPKIPAGSNAPAGLHLLSMGTAIHAEKAYEALKKEFPDLAPLSFTVSKAELGDLGATYRLIAGPTDPANAEKICADIRAKGQSCQATPFPK
ncbi:MAG: SPOR domain-containing protein [Alphaproteobacteria bacterium]|nr:SPOR domain-containing protein [Alphaproteobacteria bacterium]